MAPVPPKISSPFGPLAVIVEAPVPPTTVLFDPDNVRLVAPDPPKISALSPEELTDAFEPKVAMVVFPPLLSRFRSPAGVPPPNTTA
jgi:hypothetical protein